MRSGAAIAVFIFVLLKIVKPQPLLSQDYLIRHSGNGHETVLVTTICQRIYFVRKSSLAVDRQIIPECVINTAGYVKEKVIWYGAVDFIIFPMRQNSANRDTSGFNFVVWKNSLSGKCFLTGDVLSKIAQPFLIGNAVCHAIKSNNVYYVPQHSIYCWRVTDVLNRVVDTNGHFAVWTENQWPGSGKIGKWNPRPIVSQCFQKLPLHYSLLASHGAVLEYGGYDEQSSEDSNGTGPKDHIAVKFAVGFLGIIAACVFSAFGVWWFIFWFDRPFWWLWCFACFAAAIFLTWQSYPFLPS